MKTFVLIFFFLGGDLDEIIQTNIENINFSSSSDRDKTTSSLLMRKKKSRSKSYCSRTQNTEAKNTFMTLYTIRLDKSTSHSLKSSASAAAAVL